jgi:hypothetical protein
MRNIGIFIVLALGLTSCKREFLNPYDSQTPPESWMPVDFNYTINSSNSLVLNWTQTNSLIDGFVLSKSKNGVEERIELPKDNLNFVDPSVLNANEFSSCTDVYYSIYAKAGSFKSTSIALPNALLFPQPTPANAGSDQTPTGLSVTLNGNIPSANESGNWSIISGSGGILQNSAQPNTAFYGTAGTSYELRWSIEGSCATSYDDVSITLPINPIGTLISANDCSSLANINSLYMALSGNSAAWTISTNGYSGSCFAAPDYSLGGIYGNAIGTHYVEFDFELPSTGYVEFWKSTYYSGSQSILPSIFIDGIQQSNPSIIETQPTSTTWQKLRTSLVNTGTHTMRIQFSSQYYQLKVDEIKIYTL